MHIRRLAKLLEEAQSAEQRAELLREISRNREHLYADYKSGVYPAGAMWDVQTCLKCRALKFYEQTATSSPTSPSRTRYRLPGPKILLGPFGWSEQEPECIVNRKSSFDPSKIERYIGSLR